MASICLDNTEDLTRAKLNISNLCTALNERDSLHLCFQVHCSILDLTASAAPLLTRTTVSASSTFPRGPVVNTSTLNSTRSSLPNQPVQASSAGTCPAQTEAQPLPGQSCAGVASDQYIDAGSADVGSVDAGSANVGSADACTEDAGSAPCLSSERHLTCTWSTSLAATWATE